MASPPVTVERLRPEDDAAIAEACDLLTAAFGSGGTLAVAASWSSGGAQTSRPVLERLGFRAIAESSGEVYRLTNLNARPCPVCGAPCRCTGTLFVLPLET